MSAEPDAGPENEPDMAPEIETDPPTRVVAQDRSSRPPLPAALRPWAHWLDWLSPQQSTAIGELLLRLHEALGRYRGPVQRGGDDIAGIDELRRRGPYHRLLLSEWAVADAAPDEFLRRAGSGEHLFLTPRRETPKADAGIVAIFDGGPQQLGAPRVAQVALWILLAQRAEAAGVGFAWGTLDDPGPLYAADSVDRLRRFLSARTLRRAGDAAWSAWRTQLEAADYGERWRIGPDAVAGFSHGARLHRDLAGVLHAIIETPAGRRHLTPSLPAAEIAARLLRGQFGYATRQVRTDASDACPLSLKHPPLIGTDGEHVAIRLLDEPQAMIFRIARTPSTDASAKRKRTQATRSTRWPAHCDPMALALSRKRIAGVLVDEQDLRFWQCDHFRTQPRPPPEQLHIPPDRTRPAPCLWFNDGGDRQHFYLLDRRGRLVRWNGDAGRHMSARGNVGAWPDPVDENVLAIGRAGQRHVVYVRHRDNRPELVLHPRGERTTGRVLSRFPDGSLWPQPPTRALLCGNASVRRDGAGWNGGWAVQTGAKGGTWSLLSLRNAQDGGGVPAQIRVGGGWDVFGLCLMPGRWTHALVARSSDRRKLCAIDATGHEVLYASDVPIATVGTAVEHPLIVLVDEHRRVIALRPDGQQDARVWHEDGTPIA